MVGMKGAKKQMPESPPLKTKAQRAAVRLKAKTPPQKAAGKRKAVSAHKPGAAKANTVPDVFDDAATMVGSENDAEAIAPVDAMGSSSSQVAQPRLAMVPSLRNKRKAAAAGVETETATVIPNVSKASPCRLCGTSPAEVGPG